MGRKAAFLAALAILLSASLVQADIVAVKKSPGLSIDFGLDAAFKTAINGGTITVISGADAAIDADLWTDTGWAASNCWKNTGANGTLRSGKPLLMKFRTDTLPGFAGGRVIKAQLRLWYNGGNTGLTDTRMITSCDWAEGNKGGNPANDGNYPGAGTPAPGVTFAHPSGLNTNINQDANGGTTGPLKSWANNDWFNAAKDCGTVIVGSTRTGYSSPLPDGSNPTYDGFAVMDVTAFAQAWADGEPNYGLCTVTTGNYVVHLSETTYGPQLQPVLLINYERNAAPNAVTDLSVVATDWFKADIRWTAPSDLPPGPVSRYDIRLSTSLIDDANFEAATPIPGPTPSAPGTIENLTITGLTADTTYYVAIKCFDRTDLPSPLSNVITVRTGPPDVAPPAQIADLAAPTVKPNYVTLTWSAVGDDGLDGIAAGYDLRYSTSPITDGASFDAAIPVTGLAAPKAPGAGETFTLHGLTPSTDYWFAIKARDEVPNWSNLSNVVTVRTLDADNDPPVAIGDLTCTAAQIRVAYLAWTAPADVGTAGMAGYDIRYSTSPIDQGNWDSAVQCTGEPFPAAPGTPELFMVTGLNPNTTYYFAIKSFDYAEPPNVSAISNSAQATTLPPIVPVTVKNPWLKNDRVADTHNITTMGQTYVNAYTPDGVIPPADDEAKAINIYNNQKRRLYHWADEPPSVGGNNIDDPTYTQNIFGWCLCGRHAANACTIVNAAGLTPQRVGLPGHWIYQVQYSDGTWHAYDTMTTMYVYNKATPRKVASCAQIAADSSLLANAVADGRACPGFLLCGDTVSWFQSAMNSWSGSGNGVVTTRWTGNMDLRLGQSFRRTSEAWQSQHPNPATNADSMPGNDPPYHHECQNDWKDYVNYPYWEPYGQLIPYIHTSKATYRRWSNGTDTLAPDFRSAGYQAMLETGSTNLATWNDDQLTPDLHTATVGTQGEAIFKIDFPFYITDASISGVFVRNSAADVCKVFFSSNGTSWTQVYDAPVGTTQLTNLSLRANVFGTYQQYWIKIQMKATSAKADAGVSNFAVVTTFLHNKGALPYLDKGINNITLTFDNPAELQASRNLIHVVYKWKEYDGSDWNVSREYNGYFSSSPSTFTIAVGGTKVPRTEYILVELVPPVNDPTPPARIDTLTAGAPTFASVPLSWIATGDNGTEGQATAYDLRYSTNPITDDASFNAATQVAGVPAPQQAGSTENFTVMYLAGNTTYYFAIKAIDKGNNRSPLSNVIVATTTTPAGISDLAAGTPASGRVPLTWTAVTDGSTGTANSYDLRYSTSPITDDASFEAATQVAGVPAPKPAGSAESFTVRNLQAETTYWFAIKPVDKMGNKLPLSNIISATTGPTLAITTLAAGQIRPNKVTVTWTAIDDGNVGIESSYDLRYSTNAIVDDASFEAATQVTGLAAPQAPGNAESFTVTGLQASTTYWLAIKATDSRGVRTPLSNVVQVTTPEADVTPPKWVGNLIARPSKTAGAVDLTWTAPADFIGASGPFPCVGYQIRYSTSPIRYDDADATWNAATPVVGVPAPQAPGAAESFTVTGLTGGTLYYFAIKSSDESLPPNLSEVSNCAQAKASVFGEKVLQKGLNGYNGVNDSYIDVTTTNWAGNTRMTVCGYYDYGPNNVQRGILKFDLTGQVPPGVNITTATLYLYAWDQAQSKGTSGFYGVAPVTTAWTDTAVTWYKATSTVNWTTPGGDMLLSADPNPYPPPAFVPVWDATSPKQTSGGAPAANVWYPFDVSNRVKSWLDGTSTNNGWIVMATNEYLHIQDRFYQSEASDPALRPKLAISDLPPAKPGDITLDGKVNVFDLQAMGQSWTKQLGQRGYDPRCDLNGDNKVNVFDLQILGANWNK